MHDRIVALLDVWENRGASKQTKDRLSALMSQEDAAQRAGSKPERRLVRAATLIQCAIVLPESKWGEYATMMKFTAEDHASLYDAALKTARAALVSEFQSQARVIFQLLRPALRTWRELARLQGVQTPVVEQELLLQQHTRLPLEHLPELRAVAVPNVHGARVRRVFSAEIVAKKTQIHFRTFGGLVDQLCQALSLIHI